jgi:hypothetical protein
MFEGSMSVQISDSKQTLF